jgi:hypothetical protein
MEKIAAQLGLWQTGKLRMQDAADLPYTAVDLHPIKTSGMVASINNID